MTARHATRAHEDVADALTAHAGELMGKRFAEIFTDIEAHLDSLLAREEYVGVCRDKVKAATARAIAESAYIEMLGAGESVGYDQDRATSHTCAECAGVGELDIRAA